MNKKILVVDEDVALLSAIERLLVKSGYRAYTANSASACMEMISRQQPDLMILNHRLPDMDGRSVSQHVRAAHRFPILMLTKGVETRPEPGTADGYLSKPFHGADLVNQIDLLLKEDNQATKPPIRLGTLIVDSNRSVAIVGDTILDLTSTEFKLLALLALNQCQPMDRQTLFETVWGYDMDFNTNSLEVIIYRLRRKIDRVGGGPTIRTLRGFGYVMEPVS